LCRLSFYLEYCAGGEGIPPLRASALQIGGSGGWTGEMERKGEGRDGSESSFVSMVTARHLVYACKSVATLSMSYNSRAHAMEARLPQHVLRHACTLRNTHTCVGSLVELTFLRKLE